MKKSQDEITFIADLLRDRENELKSLFDPQGMKELKSLLFQLEDNIEGASKFKN